MMYDSSKPRPLAVAISPVAWRVAIAVLVMAGCTRSRVAGEIPNATAVELAPGVVSNGHRFMVALTPDGTALYTVERRFLVPGGPPSLVILESRRTATGAWGLPDTASFSGTWQDIDPAISPDGRRLWFNSARPAEGRDSSRSDFDIWYVDREANGWGTPRRLPAPVNTPGSDFFATAASSGALYYTAAQDVPVRRSWILRSMPLSGDRWSAPETLAVVNAPPENASNPFIAPDESWLVFGSARAGGHGDSDLYISERRGANWSTPRNLGPAVNTPLSEFAPSVSPDGKTLFFTRMRRGADRNAVEERLFLIPFASVRGGG
ncbi:MAG: PD40 domain-containing protein [Cytophagaceae bacterium]|nr:PD40 domain-containing protein [Gemmatimonadaceae bacterium]